MKAAGSVMKAAGECTKVGCPVCAVLIARVGADGALIDTSPDESTWAQRTIFLSQVDSPVILANTFQYGELIGTAGPYPSSAHVKILIVDDQAHARDSLIRLCERNDDVQVVGEAACGMVAIDAAGKLNPDIMLMDVELPDMSGFELLRAVAADTLSFGHHGVELCWSRG